jgi:AcrR family transcriptional regulator
MNVRRRLPVSARREQLLDVAETLFAETTYDEVVFDAVATHAGVSRALLYRHFPGKHALFAAVYQRAADRLLANTAFDPDLPMREQAASALDAYLDYFSANAAAVLTANVVLAEDISVQHIIDNLLTAIANRWLTANDVTEPSGDLLAAALSAWLMLVRNLSVQWLDKHALTRADVRTISLGALQGVLDAVAPIA